MKFPPSIHKIIHNFWSKKGAVLIQTEEERQKRENADPDNPFNHCKAYSSLTVVFAVFHERSHTQQMNHTHLVQE